MLTSPNTKRYLVLLKRRTSQNTWESEWQDITEYFISRESDASMSIDDETLQGKFVQNNVELKFNNAKGTFNPDGTTGSLWDASTTFSYHSRLKYYEWLSNDEEISDGEEPESVLPLIDGLIAECPKYFVGFDCNIIVASMLDILREHYILENVVGRVKNVSSQSIISYAINLFKNTYSALGVVETGGVVRQEIIYNDIVAYDRNLLELLNSIMSDGGGIAGLDRNKNLFFTYFGATVYTKANFPLTANTIGLWWFDEVDYATISGSSDTITYDHSGNGYDLTNFNAMHTGNSTVRPIEDASGYPLWDTGFFNYGAQNFYHSFGASPLSLTDYTVHLLFQVRLWRNIYDSPLTISVLAEYAYFIDITQYPIVPLFMWTTTGASDNLEISSLKTHLYSSKLGMATVYYCEGFAVNTLGKLIYVKAHNSNTCVMTIDYMQELDFVLGEYQYNLCSIGVDSANNQIHLIINSKILTTITLPVGTLNTVTKSKMLGAFYAPLFGGSSPSILHSLGLVYYSGIRLEDTFSATFENDCLSLYNSTFGSSYTL